MGSIFFIPKEFTVNMFEMYIDYRKFPCISLIVWEFQAASLCTPYLQNKM